MRSKMRPIGYPSRVTRIPRHGKDEAGIAKPDVNDGTA